MSGGLIEMIKQCKDAGLLEPIFEEKMGCFVIAIYRSIITDGYLDSLGLNERQKKALKFLVDHQRIDNSVYRKICNTIKRTATRDLTAFVDMGLLEKYGEKKGTILRLFKGQG